MNDKIKSHHPPLNKRAHAEFEQCVQKKCLTSLQKQAQEVGYHHAKQVKEHIKKLEKHVDVDSSHKVSHSDNNKDDDNNGNNDDNDGNENDDEDDNEDDGNNENDAPEAEIANVVKVNTRLTARRVTYKEGKCYQSILCFIRVKYVIFVTC